MTKCFYLGYAVRRLLSVYLGESSPDDIDSYVNKRISTAGSLFALQIRQQVLNFIKNLRMQVFKAVSNGKNINLFDFFNHRRITSPLRYGCATGNWGTQKSNTAANGGGNGTSSSQTGICQVLNTMNLGARISHMRQVNTPINRDGKQPKPRQLHLKDYGLICAAETPEGKSVGLLNVLGTLTRIRVGYPSRLIVSILFEDMRVIPVLDCTREFRRQMTVVFVNGVLCGCVEDPELLVETFREYRRNEDVPIDTSIAFRNKVREIYIHTDAGDCYRPLFRLSKFDSKFEKTVKTFQNLDPRHLWPQLLTEGIVEYVNKEEEESLRIASSYTSHLQEPRRYTHMELHSSFTIFGVSAGIIPYANHNQAPRNIYQSSMGKQSVAPQALDFKDRMDTKTNVLVYGQRPLVSTWTAEELGMDERPAGANVVVAITAFTGYNQEDSVIMNKASLDRGLFRSSLSRVFREAEVTGSECERFFGDDDSNTNSNNITTKTTVTTSATNDTHGLNPLLLLLHRRQKTENRKIGMDGLIEVGAPVGKNDVLMQKASESTTVRNENANERSLKRKRDRSVLYHPEEPGCVDRVLLSATKDDLRYVSVKSTSHRTPEIGDKFSSRHGQKGVIGMLLPPEDMPFTFTDGVVPDVILNNHAFPSRMTIGQLLESVMGKISCIEGRIADGTPFRGVTPKLINKQAKLNDIIGMGKETMINGRTGEMMKNQTFIATCFYQPLRHMVRDKIHARRRGRRQILTRQPLEGRAKKGGFRMGEMERDALLSHGVSQIIVDRWKNESDKFETYVCARCGNLADHPPGGKKGGRGGRFLRSEKTPPERIDEERLYAAAAGRSGAFCRTCGTGKDTRKVIIPYCAKLLIQELQGCHLSLKLGF